MTVSRIDERIEMGHISVRNKSTRDRVDMESIPSLYSWFLTKSVTKLALQSQKMTSSLKFRIGNIGKQNRRSNLFKQAI